MRDHDNSGIDRRVFLKATAVSPALALLAGAAADDADKALPIIDTHQHVWDLDKFTLSWLKGAGEPLERSFGPAHYSKAIEGLNVVKAVYVEVSVAPEQRIGEAEYVIALCERGGPTAAATIGGSPGTDGFRDYITRFKGNKFVKGIRESWRRGNHRDKSFLAGLRLLGELGMSFDVLGSGEALDEAAKAAAACPDTQFVLDHCGNVSPALFSPKADNDRALRDAREQWRKRITALAKLKNVVCKISGVAENGPKETAISELIVPVVDHCIDEFGPERVMFGGNWPVCLKAVTLSEWVTMLRQITARRGEEFQRRLFHDNAATFYGIKA